MIIDCVADLHGNYPKLYEGDLLIVAGDLTGKDTIDELCDEFCTWLDAAPYKKKVVICGNHDNHFDETFVNSLKNCEYLCDSQTEFEGLKIWGSPWTLAFYGMNPFCKAYTFSREEELAEKWKLIPEDIDILVTHGPPFGFMDKVYRERSNRFQSVGSISLAKLTPKSVQLHVFGHIHEGYGKMEKNNVKYVNAALVNEHYQAVNKPIRITL